MLHVKSIAAEEHVSLNSLNCENANTSSVHINPKQISTNTIIIYGLVVAVGVLFIYSGGIEIK